MVPTKDTALLMGRFESDPVSLDWRWGRLPSTGRLRDCRGRGQYVHNHDNRNYCDFVTVEGTQDAGGTRIHVRGFRA